MDALTITNHGFQTLIEEGIKAITGVQLRMHETHYHILVQTTELLGDMIVKLPADVITVSVAEGGAVRMKVDFTATSSITFNEFGLVDDQGVLIAGMKYEEPRHLKAGEHFGSVILFTGVPAPKKEEVPYKIEINFPPQR